MPPRSNMIECTCSVCGRKFLSDAPHSPKYCSIQCKNKAYAYAQKEKKLKSKVQAECPNMTDSYFESHKERIARQSDPDVWGSAPGDYAERQKQKTLALMEKIEPVQIVEKEPEDKEEKEMKEDSREVLVAMKGTLTGAALFCTDAAVTELCGKLLSAIDYLLDNKEA